MGKDGRQDKPTPAFIKVLYITPVALILFVIACIVGPSVKMTIEKAKENYAKTAKLDEENAKKAAEESLRVAKAKTQVLEWATKLNSQITPTGTYIRYPSEDLPENDPWGNPLKVSYSNGMITETLVVRSAGKDKKYGTDDDVVATNHKNNFKGVKDGIKNNVEETAKSGGKGAVKGIIEGIKDGLKGKDDEKKDGDKK